MGGEGRAPPNAAASRVRAAKGATTPDSHAEEAVAVVGDLRAALTPRLRVRRRGPDILFLSDFQCARKSEEQRRGRVGEWRWG